MHVQQKIKNQEAERRRTAGSSLKEQFYTFSRWGCTCISKRASLDPHTNLFLVTINVFCFVFVSHTQLRQRSQFTKQENKRKAAGKNLTVSLAVWLGVFAYMCAVLFKAGIWCLNGLIWNVMAGRKGGGRSDGFSSRCQGWVVFLLRENSLCTMWCTVTKATRRWKPSIGNVKVNLHLHIQVSAALQPVCLCARMVPRTYVTERVQNHSCAHASTHACFNARIVPWKQFKVCVQFGVSSLKPCVFQPTNGPVHTGFSKGMVLCTYISAPTWFVKEHACFSAHMFLCMFQRTHDSMHGSTKAHMVLCMHVSMHTRVHVRIHGACKGLFILCIYFSSHMLSSLEFSQWSF